MSSASLNQVPVGQRKKTLSKADKIQLIKNVEKRRRCDGLIYRQKHTLEKGKIQSLQNFI